MTHEQEPESSQSQSQEVDEKEEGELDNLSPPTQTSQQEPKNDQGECSSSSGEETQVYRVTPFRDEPFNYNRLGPQACHQSLSPKPWPRQWHPQSPQEARDGPLTPPSPLYLSDSAGQEPVTSTTDHRENSEPAPNDWELTPLPLPDWEIAPLPLPVPSRSNTQRRARSHSPVIFDSTPRIPIRERLGQTNSSRRRQQQAPFDYNRLGQYDGTQDIPSVPRGTCGNWSRWKMVTPWKPWKNDMIPRCAAENKRIWLPSQERDLNYTYAPEGTSNCHSGRAQEDYEADETSETESTEPADRGEEEEERN